MTTTAKNAAPAAGNRIHWAGDHSNDANYASVVSVDGAWMFLRWDGETASKPAPVLLLTMPAWQIVG